MSIATENFIKTIYNFTVTEGEDCKPGTVAKWLGISNAAATDMAKKLAKDDIVDYQKYKELKLTNKGDSIALQVIRKHRLWETFLYNVLELNMHEIHREAEGLEHLTSDFLADRINEFLGNPEFDPHGDPIPTSSGKLPKEKVSVSMNMAEENCHYTLVRTVIKDEDFFNFCKSNSIVNGAELVVKKQYSAGLTEIEIEEKVVLLPKHISKYLYISKLPR